MVPITIMDKSNNSPKQLHIKTPLLESSILSKNYNNQTTTNGTLETETKSTTKIFLKMDSSQPSGSFKIRGIGKLCQQVKEQGATHLVNSSGGNAGISTAYAGKCLGLKTTIVVPTTIAQETIQKMRDYGANVVVHGNIWNEADLKAREIAMADGGMIGYIHPFDDPVLWDGHATIMEEVYQDFKEGRMEKPDVVVCSVGGGGLFLGVSMGLHQVGWGDIPILAVETHGSHKFHQCFKEGQYTILEPHQVTSIAKTLATRAVCKAAWEQTKKHKVIPVLVTDREAVEACLKFVDHERVLVEPSCGASLAAVYKKVPELDELNPKNILVIVCGGNGTSFSILTKFSETLPK
ncbi:hypothetical protein DLAC_11776 [Tieghemostelium lacteum]|uniref:L-serine ammonia-lyase n=1 Tax=Tieghemostelium lacteum TaxID=361077 RepID=A0A151Z6G9_TIELA|nr:hypothetical protein DLAC_11776 [Tieghemostelium lacteum]|eukprot:KYQ89535.1 hypothetical protein DLAC_11776 [Tieghemostelium lacteum]